MNKTLISAVLTSSTDAEASNLVWSAATKTYFELVAMIFITATFVDVEMTSDTAIQRLHFVLPGACLARAFPCSSVHHTD